MKSIRCPECGLQNWETSEWCKRCKTILKSNEHLNNSTFAGSQNSSHTSSNANSQPNGQQTNNYQTSGQQTNSYQTGGRQTYNHARRNTGQSRPLDEINGFTAKSLRARQRNALIFCGLVVMALFGGLVFNSRYLYNALTGPFPLTQEEVLSKKYLAGSFNYYVKVDSDEVFDTGAEYVRTSKKYGTETVEYKYMALQVGDSLMLAKVDPNSTIRDGATHVSVKGALTPMSSQETEKLLAPLYAKQPELRATFLPYMIDARDSFSFWAYIWIGVGAVLTLIFGGSFISIFKSFGNLDASSSLKKLAAYGTPRQVAAMIDDEMSRNPEKIGSIFILPTWIIRQGSFTMDIEHIEDIVWIYKKTTKHSVNFIPTGKTHEVVLHTTQGGSFNLNGSLLGEGSIDKLLEIIYNRIPWVIAGYDEQLMKHWHTDSKGFIKAVADRKISFVNQAGTAQTENAQAV